MRKLPPLNPLRAFEVSGRCLSFTKAADQLCVTQAAVSRQVQVLEDYLGVKLFHRLTRQLKLTHEGELLLPVVSECFTRLATVSEAIRLHGRRETLSVRLPPFLSARWLVPQLAGFIQANPMVDLRLSHSTGKPNFIDDTIDLQVYWTNEQWPGVVTERYLTFRRIPMCSPSLLAGRHPLRQPSDLQHHTLLHEFDHQDWFNWYELAGLRPSDAARGTIVDNYEVLIEAAVDGQGVALIAVPLLADYIEERRLVFPFGPSQWIDLHYNLLYPQDALARPIVAAFRQWLLSLRSEIQAVSAVDAAAQTAAASVMVVPT